MEAGLRGAQKLPPPGKKPSHEPDRGPAKAPDRGRREEAAASRGGEEERGEEGRAAGRLRASPGRAGLPGGREAGSAGRTQGEVSSCFPWLQRGGGEGAGTLASGQGDSFFFFFFFFLFKASPLPPGGARGCGRVEAGGGPLCRCPPRRNPLPRPGPLPEGSHLGPLARPPDSSGRGGARRGDSLDFCLSHQSGKPTLGAEERPCLGPSKEERPGGIGTQASAFSQPPLHS